MPLLRIVREGVPPRGSPRHVLCGTPIPSPGLQPGFGLRPHPPGEPADSGIPCHRGQVGTSLGCEDRPRGYQIVSLSHLSFFSFAAPVNSNLLASMDSDACQLVLSSNQEHAIMSRRNRRLRQYSNLQGKSKALCLLMIRNLSFRHDGMMILQLPGWTAKT